MVTASSRNPPADIKIRGPAGTQTEVARFPAVVHAVNVTAGSFETGRRPYAVTTACGRQMPRSAVQQDRAGPAMPGGESPLCEVCQQRTA